MRAVLRDLRPAALTLLMAMSVVTAAAAQASPGR